VVPVLLLANWFLGIYFNLSMWYKLTGQTRYGAGFSLLGAAVTIVLLFVLVPAWGYLGAAWATLACYGVMMIVAYVAGQRNYPIPYDVPRIVSYILMAVLVYFASLGLQRLAQPGPWAGHALSVLLLACFAGYVFMAEKKPARKERASR
jgi:O-antigen/teichoic acid export membrane protein